MKARKFSANSKKKKIITGAASGALLGCCLLGYVYMVTQSPIDAVPGANPTVTETAHEIKTVLVAAKNMEAGDFANGEVFKFIEVDTRKQPLPADAVQELDQLKDKRLKVSMAENEMLQSSKLIPKTAWYEEGDRLVEINFIEGAIPTIIPRDQLIGCLVDIKLFKKGAEDKIVIPKVAVVAADGNKLGFYLNHKEMDSLKEAATEPDGLYLAVYIDELQEASSVTYQPSYN